MSWVAKGFAILTTVVGCLGVGSAMAAAQKQDPRFVWPTNSQFSCSGFLVQEEGTYRLNPVHGMLTWCDADIGSNDKGRVLEACGLKDRCEIEGTIRGHGNFGWVKITSVRSTGDTAGQNLSEVQARSNAAAVLKGDPYGRTASAAASRIQKGQLLVAGTSDCGKQPIVRPVWQFHVTVPANVISYGSEAINGYLVLDARSGKMLCTSLPFLD